MEFYACLSIIFFVASLYFHSQTRKQKQIVVDLKKQINELQIENMFLNIGKKDKAMQEIMFYLNTNTRAKKVGEPSKKIEPPNPIMMSDDYRSSISRVCHSDCEE